MEPNLTDYGPFSFRDSFAGMVYWGRLKKGTLARAEKVFEETRLFCRQHLRPLALGADLAAQRDPRTLAWELVDLAARHRMLSRLIPRFLGGSSPGVFWALYPCIEELAAADPGFLGLLGGHELGLTALALTLDFPRLEWVCRRVVQGELSGRPFLIDCALTEPSAGTDYEEAKLLQRAGLTCRAEKVPGGAVLNGRKCFISTGHLASCHLVIIPFDDRDRVGSLGGFLVPRDAPGFSLGVLEEKMGQKAGPASELIFEDCFVPDEFIVARPEGQPPGYGETLLETVLGITRTAVGAWSTGIARGAFEAALDFARTTRSQGRPLATRQWVQELLTDMLANVFTARAVYCEASAVLFRSFLPAELPRFTQSSWFARLYHHPGVRRLRYSRRAAHLARNWLAGQPVPERQRLQYYSSLAKVVGSDLGLANCNLALDLMGREGLRHEAGVEKLYRDAKLCQIFEGTNQLNRLHMFENYVARRRPEYQVFGGD
ncbi:MAG: acyl-CoA dehydrogenase [Thermodesulfobacteriota bacterium]